MATVTINLFKLGRFYVEKQAFNKKYFL